MATPTLMGMPREIRNMIYPHLIVERTSYYLFCSGHEVDILPVIPQPKAGLWLRFKWLFRWWWWSSLLLKLSHDLPAVFVLEHSKLPELVFWCSQIPNTTGAPTAVPTYCKTDFVCLDLPSIFEEHIDCPVVALVHSVSVELLLINKQIHAEYLEEARITTTLVGHRLAKRFDKGGKLGDNQKLQELFATLTLPSRTGLKSCWIRDWRMVRYCRFKERDVLYREDWDEFTISYPDA